MAIFRFAPISKSNCTKSIIFSQTELRESPEPLVRPTFCLDCTYYHISRLGMLLMRWRMFSWGISSQTWIKASVNSWTVCGATWRWWMEWDTMSQMCSIGFRSGERASQSIASMPSSCRNCWHTSATWGLALSCIRRNPGPTAPAYGLTMGLKISFPVPNSSQVTSG